MARLRPLELHEVDDEIRALCELSERNSGTSESARTLAHHPPVVKALAAFRGALAKERVLDPTLVELVRLKVANRNACRYWMKVRYAGARQAGLTEMKIAAIDDPSSDLISPRERAALTFAELMATDHHKVDDAVFAELRRHFSDAELVELGVSTALFVGFGRLNTVFGL